MTFSAVGSETVNVATPAPLVVAPRSGAIVELPLPCERSTFEPGTTLPFASCTVTVIVVVATPSAVTVPLAAWTVEVPASAGPGTTVKVVVAPTVSGGVVVAVSVTGPARVPVTSLVATPLPAVTAPARPLTAPAPPLWENVTLVELSVVTVLPLASSIVAVIVRVEPEARFPVAELTTTWLAAPALIVKLVESSAVRPPSLAWSL